MRDAAPVRGSEGSSFQEVNITKSDKNKTIDFTLEEGKEYLDQCLKVNAPVDLDTAKDKIIIGDCLEICAYLPEKSVDLMIADPPYNLFKDFNGSSFREIKPDEYRSYTENWLEKTLPLLKDNASVYVCCDWKSSLMIGDVLGKYLKIRNRITWQREKGRGAKKNWKNSMEDIWFATVGKEYKFNLEAVMQRRRVVAPYRVDGKPKDWDETEKGNFRNTCPSNFWDDISVPYWSMPENTAHPTQKPEKLYAKLILASSDEGDMVFDPFGGSGTAAVTAKKLNRRFMVIEKEELYCAWAEKRLSMADKDPSIQGYRNGVFWERNTLNYRRKKDQ